MALNLFYRLSDLNSTINGELNSSKHSNSIFDNHLQSSKQQFAVSPLLNSGISEIGRLRDELQSKNSQIQNYEEQLMKANQTCEAWKLKIEEGNRKVRFFIPWWSLNSRQNAFVQPQGSLVK